MDFDKDKYKKLIKDVKIMNILLKELKIDDVKLPNKDNEDVQVELTYKCENFNSVNDIIEFYPLFNISVLKNKDVFVNIEFTLRAIYEIEDLKSYDQVYIAEFIDRNIPVNVWPYAREIISSLTTRIGYPALVIDPFKRS
ncbi:protein-export chaperone SecB [Clostridium combesii]|uniref:Preprotein translocase subunit SecB n=1 Tax=Clostridium combesii TaxID=39481 RepID=A0A2G7HJG1_9CLOT|nr:protein-export chaperone SecB [Clostridium combesii]PIH05229.1 hypothetical protein CS538_05210 [Clostridium combesii]